MRIFLFGNQVQGSFLRILVVLMVLVMITIFIICSFGIIVACAVILLPIILLSHLILRLMGRNGIFYDKRILFSSDSFKRVRLR
jgi:hypothetical protein